MPIETYKSEKLRPPVGPFSPAAKSGELIFFSGQVGQDPNTGELAPGGIEAEAKQLFANLEAILSAAGKSFRDVVRVGVFLTDIADFAIMNALYADHFPAPFPARTTIGVAALPMGACVEIEMVAAA